MNNRYPPKKKRLPFIKQTVFKLLCEIRYYEDRGLDISPENRVEVTHPNARSVGHPYKVILAKIKKTFPLCNPSVEDIRRYATLIRRGEAPDMRLAQRRPRPNEE